MPTSLPSALYVLTVMVEDWSGEGPAIIHWAARRQADAPLPWGLAPIIADRQRLPPARHTAVADAVNRFFTYQEAEDLAALLVQGSFGGPMTLRYGRVDLPMTADVALTMQEPNPFGAQTLWRVRPPDPVLAGRVVPCEGIVSLWPWPGLTPEDIAPLMAMRDRLGVRDFPPKPSA